MTSKRPSKKALRAYPTLVITKYMGSKKAVIGFVAGEIERLIQPGDMIVDLMAGSHTIGFALKGRCRIIANDVQRFSRVIGHTLLNYNPEQRFEGAMRDAFRRFYLANMRLLEEQFAVALRMERALLSALSGARVPWREYRDFCDGYPFHARQTPAADWPEEFLYLFGNRRLQAFRTLHKLEPYNLFSLYYANAYVGIRQAAEIDSLRCAIDKLCDGWLPEHPDPSIEPNDLRSLLLAALISVLNRINPGPGHWASVPRVSQSNHNWLVAQRSLSAFDLFMQKVAELEAALAKNQSPYCPHIVMTEDYVSFMREVNEYIRQARVVYLDPPYSQGHYSRFYHLIETLVQYDYPEIAHEGRYRTDRHQSPFASREKVAGAVGRVCEVVREAGATLVISYPHGGIIPDSDRFYEILRAYYPEDKIELKKLPSVHSKLGQAKRMKTTEYLFICRS